MRYEVRWSNGFYKVFDTFRYTSVYVTELERGLFGMKADAISATALMNGRAAKGGR